MRSRSILLTCAVLLLPAFDARGFAQNADRAAIPNYRVEADGFGAPEADIRAVLDSAARELYRYFPDYSLEPIDVSRGHSGPITLFQRNDRHEIVIHLDTEKTAWSQYAYQFSHELCHVLCGFNKGYRGNMWFEETLCETASLFTMRAMARSWKDSPPYPNWRDYRDSLREYVDNTVHNRDKIHELFRGGLHEFYLAHKAELEKTPGSRELNGAMAIVFLQLFEERPQRWEAVRWLNSQHAPDGETFTAYLQRWHEAAPARHQWFVKHVAELYGVEIRSDAREEPSIARALLKYRIEADGFHASQHDIRAVLDSAASQLWRHFPDYPIEPFVVVRGQEGPIVIFPRNPQGEIVVKLDTHDMFWCQYAYQFAYLFADILCGFNEKSVGNKWFEVSVCDAASLYALKQMARSWEQNPPYPNWKDYHHALADYVRALIDRRSKIEPDGLKKFYDEHREALAQGGDSRPLAESVAVALLAMFEEQPEHWEAVRWLNSAPSPAGEPLERYLQRWHDAVPKKHQPFVVRVAESFGLRIKSSKTKSGE
jgi:hypothetical protein